MYITDNYTGNSIDRVNVTETQFVFNTQDGDLCLMYQVSAWNAGGEGELSEPVQDSTPQGKSCEKHNYKLYDHFCFSFFSLPIAENIHVVVTAESGVLQLFRIEVKPHHLFYD